MSIVAILKTSTGSFVTLSEEQPSLAKAMTRQGYPEPQMLFLIEKQGKAIRNDSLFLMRQRPHNNRNGDDDKATIQQRTSAELSLKCRTKPTPKRMKYELDCQKTKRR